jgi:hypothetical protein
MSPSSSDVRRSIIRALAAANAAFVGGEALSVAEQLREAWRASRDPGLAALYEVWVRAHAPALPGRDSIERAKAWRETATRAPGDPMWLASLLDEPSHADMPEL